MIYLLLSLIFWSAIGFIVYTYLLYPLILYVIYNFKRRPPVSDIQHQPGVSIIISAYNEENIIEEKIKNILEINYPKEKIEVLIGLDGCSDNTPEILKKYYGNFLHVIEFPNRRGKAAVLNDLVELAKSDIIVFSDANTIYESDAIENLVRHFHDPAIGGVCGKLELLPHNKNIGSMGESMYWRYENMLKLMEGTINTTIGATGAIYAIRKSLYRNLPVHKIVTDDFLIPLHVVSQGQRVIFDHNAIGYEKTAENIQKEYSRKVRIGVANFVGLSEIKHLLKPRWKFIAFALWSHKIIRWFVPFLMLLILISNLGLVLVSEKNIFNIILLLQIVFYTTAAAGYIMDRFKIYFGIFGYPYFFVSMNWALLIGFIRFILNRKQPTWNVMR